MKYMIPFALSILFAPALQGSGAETKQKSSTIITYDSGDVKSLTDSLVVYNYGKISVKVPVWLRDFLCFTQPKNVNVYSEMRINSSHIKFCYQKLAPLCNEKALKHLCDSKVCTSKDAQKKQQNMFLTWFKAIIRQEVEEYKKFTDMDPFDEENRDITLKSIWLRIEVWEHLSPQIQDDLRTFAIGLM